MTALDRLRRLMRRLRLLAQIGRRERAMHDEMQHHIACETAARMRAGESSAQARRGALRDFGGVERFKEEARDARGVRPIEDLLADTRYALRIIRHNPLHAAAVVVTFGLGIAAAGAIFAVVYGVLLRPLPYADPARLVVLWERNVPRNRDRNVVSPSNFDVWRERSTSFTGMAALVPRPVTLTRSGVPERVMGAEVSPGYFGLLGVAPALGRDFSGEDAQAASSATILSHEFWQRQFGGDPSVVGRSLVMGDSAATIVGVMPKGFEPPRFGWLGTQELWFPFASTPENRGWGRFLLVVARLKAGVALDRARAEMTTMADRLANEVPADKGWSISIVPLAEQITGDVRTALRVLLAAVALLFFIAAANVATLMATATRRRGAELDIRRSFGATDGRLFRQLFTQHLLLGLAGAAAGLVLVAPAVDLITSLAPPSLPRLQSIRVDAPALAATIAVVAIAIVAFCLVASRPRRESVSRLGAAAPGRSTARAGGGWLIGIEIAVALTLGIMATLMTRSFAGLRTVDLGFDPDRVVAARVAVSGRVADGAPTRAFFDDLVARLRAMPGVQSAGVISTRPFFAPGVATVVSDPARRRTPPDLDIVADIRYVDATLFDALRIPIVSGSTFDRRESESTPIAVVVSESLAREVWGAEPPLGRELRVELYNGIQARVVGVAGDIHVTDARTPTRPAAYLSIARFPSDTRDVVVRTAGDPTSVVPALRSEVAALAPGTPLFQVEPLDHTVDLAIAPERSTAYVLSAFAGIALLLGGVGVFGVIAGEVGRRRREIGLRMALGAGGSRVTWMIVRQTLARAGGGVLAGVLLTLWLSRSMTSLLFGIAPLDPASYLSAIAAVLGLALVATLIPVVSALRNSPLAALHEN